MLYTPVAPAKGGVPMEEVINLLAPAVRLAFLQLTSLLPSPTACRPLLAMKLSGRTLYQTSSQLKKFMPIWPTSNLKFHHRKQTTQSFRDS